MAGIGKVTVVPDLATIRLGVLIERDAAKAARNAAAEAMTGSSPPSTPSGIDDKDIPTATISLQPVYDYPNNSSPKIRGYQLQNAVTITVRDLDKVSDVIDHAVESGATPVNGMSFDVADRATAEAKAREAAVADAKAKADSLATGLGVNIPGVATMSETVSTPVWYDREMARGCAGRSRRLDPGHGRHDRRDHRRPGDVPDRLARGSRTIRAAKVAPAASRGVHVPHSRTPVPMP